VFLGKEILLPKNTNLKKIEDYLEHIDVKILNERILVKGTCLIADLKIKAIEQLARGWLATSSETEVIRIYILHNIVY